MGLWKYSTDYKEYRANDGNNSVFRWCLLQVQQMAVSVVTWDGLPNKQMSRDIEFFAYTNRQACICDWHGVPTVCKCATVEVNMLGEPVAVLVTFPDGGDSVRRIWNQENARDEDVILIRDLSVQDFGRVDSVALWADRYTDGQTTIDTQVVTQRTPILISGADRNRLDKAGRITVDLATGVKAIAVDDGVVNSVSVLDLNAPWQVPDIVQWQNVCWKRMLSAIGVDAGDWQKSERLVVDEQEGNDESLALILQCMLDSRMIAAEQMTAKYGWPADPHVITPVRVKSETDTDDGEGGETDAPVQTDR